MAWWLLQEPALPDGVLAGDGRVEATEVAVASKVTGRMLEMKVREREGKVIMRRLLRKYFPDAMIDRDKAGFGLPLAYWLRGPLRDWAKSLSDPARIAREGWFEPESVRRLWEPGNEDVLWRIVMFQQWLDDRR